MAIEPNNNNLETTNINLRWLTNIYEQIINIEQMERMCREGCSSLIDYLQIPPDQRGLVLPDAQYKTLRFLVLEMDLLINNLAPILAEKTELYKKRIEKVLEIVDNRTMFLKPIYSSEKVLSYFQVLDLLPKTISYLSSVVSDLIKDIGSLLFIAQDEQGKKKW